MTIQHIKTTSLRNIMLTISACALLAACGDSGADQSQAAVMMQQQAPKVTVAAPLKQDVIDTDTFTGRFEPVESVDIRARVNGYLQSIDFTDGALVEAGDKLFVIDPRPFEAIVNQRQADLRAANSRIELAKNTFDRTDKLFKSGDISAQILDQRKSEYDEARASVAQAQAALRAAELDLAYTTIKAPISGRISRQLVSTGNLINAGQDVLTTILSVDPIYFYFDVDEQTYLKHIRRADPSTAGQDAHIALSDETDFPREAKIDFIDNRLSSNTGTLRGRAVVDNPGGIITPGMFGRIKMASSGSYEAILIPDTAIGTDQSRKFVMVVDKEGNVESRAVELGQLHGPLRVITNGLDGSELIVINGLQRARPGAKVAPEIVDLNTPPAPQQ